MKLARSCKIDVADVDIIVNEIPLYLAKRYDRKLDSKGKITRLHQVDFCQAQNCLVSEKYESDGGPTLKDNYKVIQKVSSNVIKDTKRYLAWICFNILIGNNDSHSKNISFVFTDNKFLLSPFYDLLCTSIYKEYNTDFAFKIGGVNSWGHWDNTHFKSEIISWGLDKNPNLLVDTLLKLIKVLQKVLPLEVERFNEQFPEIKVANRIRVEIEKRIKSFSKRLKH